MDKTKGRALLTTTLVALLVGATHNQAAAETLYQADGDTQWRNTRGGMLAQGFQSSSESPWLTSVTVKLRNQDDAGGAGSAGSYRISLWQGAAGRPGSKLENLTTWQSLAAGSELSETVETAVELEGAVEHFIVVEGTGTVAWDCTFDTPQPDSGPLNTRESSDGSTWDDIQDGTCLGAHFSLTVEASSSEPPASTPPTNENDSNEGAESDAGADAGSGNTGNSGENSDAGSSSGGTDEKVTAKPGNDSTSKPTTAPATVPTNVPTTVPTTRPVTPAPAGTNQPVGKPESAATKPVRTGDTVALRRLAKMFGTDMRSVVTLRSITPKICRVGDGAVRINRAGICRLRIVFDKGPVRRHATMALVVGK